MKRIIFGMISFLFGLSVIHAQDNSVCNHPSIKIIGQAEEVFVYNRDKCTPLDTPDTPAMAFKDASGTVHLFNGIGGSFASVGPSLTNVHRDCSKPLNGELAPPSPQTPDSYDNWKWIRSPWTSDGKIIYGLIHNEFHGTDDKQKYCPAGNGDTCLYPSVTVSRSTDGGKTFHVFYGPKHEVALAFVSPEPYKLGVKIQAGVRAPTNIVSMDENGKTYFYALANVRGGPGITQVGGTCVFRSDDITNAHRWRAWDGKGFNVVMNATPYRDQNVNPSEHVCKPVFKMGASSWTYNTLLHQFVAIIGINTKQSEAFGYITSKDGIHWSQPQPLMQTTNKAYAKSKWHTNVSAQTYQSLIDPESPGMNFEYSGTHPYLFYTRMNPKMGNWRNRDLLRVPLEVSCEG